ncbi:hypothetical protein P175DRAFT_0544167 [Aspergillus ochraceoroseus IBT 24754]|uniref:AflY n=3 Tax=Aspergillus subgen. Nidulantes TaxID=2720870 RepID=A0A0F8WW79_9EURO|nr:uncharacterized protein P175DRAFT_0544167 [Aspergillus ochraceoroseus IBT 24754]KKK21810.1 hypothetical protein ARAM_004335 [Aspergillus rambellii]KKK22282.1 hypothetical protein AOCH_000138 [Aspergillus ochraceoroseus]PTU23639.1 hypothetical protein P175DRAFT_0544167 [Aspergillus ochraceoroseus IBT 24754]
MASSTPQNTPYNIQLSASDTPGRTHVEGLTQESADRVSELLMINYARYHTLFDAVGFHNHTVHHLLTLYALGATPDEIRAMYDLNKGYQALVQYRPVSTVLQLKDRSFFQQCLGDLSYYDSYVRFFQDEIAQRGIPDVVNEYLFQGDEISDDILGRMHSGFLHPMIHLGCALEFNQPLLVAEALAAGCVHDDWPHSFLFPVEKHMRAAPETPVKSMLDIMDELYQDATIRNAVQMSDPLNKISDGLLAKVCKQLIPYLAQYRVQPTAEELEKQTMDMVHTCAYMIGAAQYPGKVEALDFVLLHTLTLSIFYPTFMTQDWITNENKARLLHFKAWGDLVMYAGCGCPTLYPQRITEYVPKRPSHGWKELAHRASVYGDDGHICKVVRGLLHAERLPDPRPGFPLQKGDFLKIAHLGLDSVERMLEPGQYKVPDKIRKEVGDEMGQDEEIIRVMVRWVRWCGVDGAWNEFPDLLAPCEA